jgi:hypothetical protein
VSLDHIEPDGSPTRPFPPHLRCTDPGWSTLTVHEGGIAPIPELVHNRKVSSTSHPLVSLGRYAAHFTNQAAEVNNRLNRRFKEQRKAEAGAAPVPIPELDQQRLISNFRARYIPIISLSASFMGRDFSLLWHGWGLIWGMHKERGRITKAGRSGGGGVGSHRGGWP